MRRVAVERTVHKLRVKLVVSTTCGPEKTLAYLDHQGATSDRLHQVFEYRCLPRLQGPGEVGLLHQPTTSKGSGLLSLRRNGHLPDFPRQRPGQGARLPALHLCGGLAPNAYLNHDGCRLWVRLALSRDPRSSTPEDVRSAAWMGNLAYPEALPRQLGTMPSVWGHRRLLLVRSSKPKFPVRHPRRSD